MKPCPFCGATDGLWFCLVPSHKWGFVRCSNCGAQGPEVRTGYDTSEDAPWRADAEREWNGRVEEPPQEHAT